MGTGDKHTVHGPMANVEDGEPSGSGRAADQMPPYSYVRAPKSLKAFPAAYRATSKTQRPGGGLRRRWKDESGAIFEWDYQHGKVEKYNRLGHHLGEFDPETGEQTKPATNRRIEP
jgi:hypothetical protein